MRSNEQRERGVPMRGTQTQTTKTSEPDATGKRQSTRQMKCVYLPPELHARVKAAAERHWRGLNHELAYIVEQYLNEHDDTQHTAA